MRVFDRIYNEGLKFDAVNKTDVLCMPGMLGGFVSYLFLKIRLWILGVGGGDRLSSTSIL